jgi:hypothetical protein
MFNVVIARLLGDHIAPDQRRYDTPSASSIGQPLRLYVNVPDLTRPGSDSVCHTGDVAKTPSFSTFSWDDPCVDLSG